MRRMVPLAGIEPALLAELDFESSASTSSATGARAWRMVGDIERRPGGGQSVGARRAPTWRFRLGDQSGGLRTPAWLCLAATP